MQHRTLSTALAVLATTVGACAFATSAQAVVVDNDATSMIGDPEEMLRDANLAWDLSGGVMRPRLTGTITLNDADGKCYAPFIKEYDGSTLLHSKRGAKHCPPDDDTHEYEFVLNGHGDPLTDTALVGITEEGANGWSIQDRREHTVEPSDDTVTLESDGLDVGGWPFPDGATISWTIDGGLVTPEFDGFMYFFEYPFPSRVKLRLLDEAGTLVDEVAGPNHNVLDNAYYLFHDTFAGTPSALVTQVEVVMERQAVGTVDSETVSIAE
jgi:hypothetical protein